MAHPVIYRLKAGHRTVVVPNGVRLRSDSEFPFSLYAGKGYDAHMALARILVDGYSLLYFAKYP